jgi:hypothetical protein
MKARQIMGVNDTVTIVAAAAITAKRMVTALGTHAAAQEAVGVALFDTDSGSEISVGVAPIEMVETGGTCTAGGGLKTDSSGRVVDQGGSGIIVGYALDTAGATAGEFIRVLLVHGGNTA